MKNARGGAIAFALVLAYVLLRCVVFAGGPVRGPALSYLVNKALAVTGLVLFGVARLSRNTAVKKSTGEIGFAALGLHVVLSTLLFAPRVYPGLHLPSGAMTWYAEIAILAGLVGWIALLRIFLRFALAARVPPPAPSARPAALGAGDQVLLCGALHCVALGLSGWLSPRAWPGHLPPLTLIGFAIALAVLGARAVGHLTIDRRRGHEATATRTRQVFRARAGGAAARAVAGLSGR